jgi:hypothetical protein
MQLLRFKFFYHRTTDKSFNTSQNAAYQYTVGDLNNGMYVVKAYNVNEELQVMKFIKSSFVFVFFVVKVVPCKDNFYLKELP